MISLFLALAFGGLGLYFGAEWLIRGAGSLALRLGISPVIVGLTIIGYGTSTPELVVSIDAAMNQQPDISLGNIIGSNISNIGLIIGLCLILKPLTFHRQLALFDGLVMIASALLCALFVGTMGIGRLAGSLFLVMLLGYTLYTIKYEKNRGSKEVELMKQEVSASTSLTKDMFCIFLGLAVLLGGSKVFLYGAVGLARLFSVSEAAIGLTLVAVGTSLPELATSLLAAWRNKSDLAVGNIVGSNIYNILGILGLVGLFSPIAESQIRLADYAAMILFTLAFYGMIWNGKKAGRFSGAILLGAYAIYVYSTFRG